MNQPRIKGGDALARVSRPDLQKNLSDGAANGYDRNTVWLDRPELPIAEKRLARHCTALTVTAQQMQFNARWKLQLDIHQPTLEFFRLLRTAVGHDIAVRITYTEIACDVPAADKAQARQWRNAFLASARVPYQRHPMVSHLGTEYYGRRTQNGVRRGHVLALYADWPSKLNNAQPPADAPPCLHIEWRASGSAALMATGLVTLTDLIEFDHSRFWDERLRMFQLPRKTDLGRLLAIASGADIDVSGSALRKRAERWLARHSENGKFVLHNALQEYPALTRQLQEVPFWDWLQTELDD